jgi:MFS family permease
MCHAACDDFSSLAAVRTFLGALGAGCNPASMIIFGMYYTRAEQPLRMGICIGFGGVAFILGGILGRNVSGQGHLKGKIPALKKRVRVFGYRFVLVTP